MIISIIIPVYNAQNFLGTCLNSVIIAITEFKKHYKGINRFEILLVDNGSTDLSRVIAREYKVLKPLALKLLECQTPGAAAARNFGAAHAKGQYLWFIDADDTIAPDAIWKLIDAAEENQADLVMLSAERVYDNVMQSQDNVSTMYDNIIRQHDSTTHLYDNVIQNADGKRDHLKAITPDNEWKSKFIRYGMGPWQVLIRRSWWQAHDFKFKEGIIHEDMELMPALALYTDRFASVEDTLYFYRQTPDSVLHKSAENPHIFDIFPALEGLYARFKKAHAIEKYHAELEWFFIWNLLLDSAKDFARSPDGRRGFRQTRATLKKYFPRWRRNRFLREKPLKTRLRVRLNYFS